MSGTLGPIRLTTCTFEAHVECRVPVMGAGSHGTMHGTIKKMKSLPASSKDTQARMSDTNCNKRDGYLRARRYYSS